MYLQRGYRDFRRRGGNQLGYKLSVHSGTMAAIAFVLLSLSLPWGILATALMVVVGWVRKRTKNLLDFGAVRRAQ